MKNDVNFTIAIKRSTNKKKQNRSICDDDVFNAIFSINNDDDSLFITQRFLVLNFAKLIDIRSNFAKIARRNTRIIK